MSFVLKILYYPSISGLCPLAPVPEESAGLGAQAGAASVLPFCLLGTEKSLQESFQNSELKVHPQSCSSGARSGS